MFESAQAFNADLGNWDIRNVLQMVSMFKFSGLSFEDYDAILAEWSQQDVRPNINVRSCRCLFFARVGLKEKV